MANIYIVEDNTNHLNLLRLKTESLGHTVVGTSTNSNNALTKIQKNNPDGVLVDINLDGDNEGIDLAREIKTYTDAFVIYTTSQSKKEVISSAIETNPSGYLIKPVDPNELHASIELAMSQQSKGAKKKELTTDFLSVRIGEKLQLIEFKDIKYLVVESKNYVTIVDTNDKRFVVRDSLKNILHSMLPESFIRTNHSYGVNVEFISFIDEKEQTIYLKSNDSIPIGKSFRKSVYDKMNIKT